MSYKELIDNLKETALKHALIESFQYGNSVYEANFTDNKYPLLYVMYQPHQIDNPINNYSFVFYYIDRLLEDKSNEVDVHNSGLKSLNDVLIDIDLNYDNTEYKFPTNMTLFVEKFADYCAGVFAEVSIQTYNENNECTTLENCK